MGGLSGWFKMNDLNWIPDDLFFDGQYFGYLFHTLRYVQRLKSRNVLLYNELINSLNGDKHDIEKDQKYIDDVLDIFLNYQNSSMQCEPIQTANRIQYRMVGRGKTGTNMLTHINKSNYYEKYMNTLRDSSDKNSQDQLYTFLEILMSSSTEKHNNTEPTFSTNCINIIKNKGLLDRLVRAAEHDRTAHKYLKVFLNEYLKKGGSVSDLPVEVITYALNLYAGVTSKPKKGKSVIRVTKDVNDNKIYFMNIDLAYTVWGLHKILAIKPTRNDLTKSEDSGCDIVASRVKLAFKSIKGLYLAKEYKYLRNNDLMKHLVHISGDMNDYLDFEYLLDDKLLALIGFDEDYDHS